MPHSFLYVLGANATQIDVLSLKAPGQATGIQTVDIAGPARADAWTRYLRARHPGLRIVHVESYVEKTFGPDATAEARKRALDILFSADVRGDEVKTRPRGVPADHPRLDLMRCRSLMVSTHLDPERASSPQVVDDVRAHWRAIRPLAEWAEQYVGAPDT